MSSRSEYPGPHGEPRAAKLDHEGTSKATSLSGATGTNGVVTGTASPEHLRAAMGMAASTSSVSNAWEQPQGLGEPFATVTVLEQGGQGADGTKLMAARSATQGYDRGASIGRYIILDILGRGGMGAVYAAYDPELDRRIAVKLLHTAQASTRSRKRLVREARALAKLSHPHVVQVYDAGVHQDDVFVAMELVDGTSFKAWCASEPRPGWREILAAYLEAASGLAAAHAEGLVHRDVKPANLLRGKDGRVRVADFGLAAAQERSIDDSVSSASLDRFGSGDDSLPSAPSLDGRLDERLTAHGTVMGTPAFMAPEQHVSAEVGPAADQYSLCVSLYEGLYGCLPFPVKKSRRGAMAVLLEHKLRGDIAPPPAASPVPPWVYQALVRGVAARPEDRYPSMEALIAALRDDPYVRRRARLRVAGVALVTLALSAMAMLGWMQSGGARDQCGAAERELAGIWDRTVGVKVRDALVATGRPYASHTADRVHALLDQYAGAWTSMRIDVCRAHARGDMDREVYTLRTICLERRRQQLGALTAVLAAGPDPTVLDNAARAARELYPIEYCADVAALTARVKPPEDPALRARVEVLEPRVFHLEALYTAGTYEAGRSAGEVLLRDLEGLEYAPLRARATYWLGLHRVGAGAYDDAERLLRQAMELAATGKDLHLLAAAGTQLLHVVGSQQQRMADAQPIIEWLSMVIEYADDDPIRARWLGSLATVQWRKGDYEQARTSFEHALAIGERALGPDHLDVALWLNNLGNTLWSMGDYLQARDRYERALAIRESALGPDHPDVAASLGNMGMVLKSMGEYQQAKVAHERSLAIREQALGPEHPSVATSLNNLAILLATMGDDEQAAASLERALAIREQVFGPEHPLVASSLGNLANQQRLLGQHEQSRANFERALVIREKLLGATHPDVAYSLTGLGRALVALGDTGAAIRHLERSLAIREAAHGSRHPMLVDSLLALGEAYLARNQPTVAIPPLERALAIGSGSTRADIELTLAQALWAMDMQRPRARELVERARAFYESIGNQQKVAESYHWLAEHPLATRAPARRP